MAYSTPRSWTTGELVTAAHMNQDVRDNISFLANPPACRVYNTAAQSMADATINNVLYNAERYDTDGMHSTSVDTGRITFNTAGLYLVSFHGELAAGADYTAVVARILRGAIVIASHQVQGNAVALGPTFSVSALYKAAVGDYVVSQVYQDNTANAARNLNAAAEYSPEFSAVWMGLG